MHLNPVATINPRNRETNADIQRIHDPGKNVLDEVDRLEQLADLT